MKKIKKTQIALTDNYMELNEILDDARENRMVMSIVSPAGSGKTYTARYYSDTKSETYMLCCSEYWNRNLFVNELLQAMDKDIKGLSLNDKVKTIVDYLITLRSPLIIIDEADKLPDRVLFFLITLYNNIEDECGMVLLSTDYLNRRFKIGLEYNKMGYAELWSRIGKRCIPLEGVTSDDIQKICKLHSITSQMDINAIIKDSDSDLRRVKRKIHAILRKRKTQK